MQALANKNYTAMRLVVENESEPVVTGPKVLPPKPPAFDALPGLVSKKVAITASVVGLAAKLRPFIDRASLTRQERLEKLQSDVDQYARYHSNALVTLARAKRDIETYKKSHLAAKKELNAAKKEKETPWDGQAVVDRLRKHQALQYARVSPQGRLMLYFRPVYTQAYLHSDTKDTQRMLAGCYLVTLTPGKNVSIKVKNLTFPGIHNPHWTVSSSGAPCLGTWEPDVKKLWADGKLYDLVTLLAAYLSSNLDSTGYSRTYYHREKRKHCIQVLNDTSEKTQPSVGQYAIYIGHDTSNGVSLHHLPGIVIKRGGSHGLSFAVDVPCNSYGFSDERDWWIDWPYLHPVPVQEVAALEAFIESVKGEPDERERVREYCERILEKKTPGRVTRDQAVTALLAHLDSAESLDYATVAQPLVIDLAKLNHETKDTTPSLAEVESIHE